MKKFILSVFPCISLYLILFSPSISSAQVFWTEAFQNGCAAGCFATAYTGPNGTWTQASTGLNDPESNKWFVSGAECGNAATQCGTTCGATDPSLHIGADDGFVFDPGAAYDAGGFCGVLFCVTTNMRVESPTINCTGQSTITLAFNYIENGDGAIDDASLWYYDGATWAQINALAKPSLGPCAPQGQWTAFSIPLPVSANNNPNVKIGFNWTNNDDGVGTDPSFAVDDITLSVPSGSPPVASFSVTPSTTICAGSCVNFTDLSTGSPTSWSWTFLGGSPNASAIQNPTNICYNTAGTYTATLVATNSNGSSMSSQVITVNALPIANAGIDITICQSANTTLNATGGGTYLWSPSTGLSNPNISNPVASPTITTNYTVTVTNSCGSNSDAVNVTVSPLPTANAGADVTMCPGDNATLTATGGGTYAWSPGGQTTATITVSPTSTTTYSITVTNSCGSSTDAVNVVISNSITASISGNTTICSGQSTTLTASGGSNYSWSNSTSSASVVLSPTSTSTYSVFVSSGSCADTAYATITVLSVPSASISGNTTLCSGQSTTLTASGGNFYSWVSGGQTTSSIIVSPSSNTTYSVVVSNGNCYSILSASVTVSTLSVLVSCPTDPCFGGTYTINAFGGNTYSWNTGDTGSSITVIATSVSAYYVVTVSDSVTGCSGMDSCLLAYPPDAVINLSGNDTICSGDSLTLTTISGQVYFWSTGATTVTPSITVNPTATITYFVVVVNGLCMDSAFATITVLPSPAASISGNSLICVGDAATLTASGGGTYAWNTAATSPVIVVNPAATTNYSVVVTGANGCTASVAATVTVFSAVTASVTGNNSLCQGDSTLLTASGGGNYSWNTGETTAAITVSSAGNYSVFVSAGSCSDTAATTVVVNPNPIASAGVNVSISQGASATLTATGGGTYLWNNGESNASITVTPSTTTIYCVTVSDANNCTDISCVTVYVEPLDCSGEIYLPNAFSPNGDLENDELQIYYGNFLCIKFLQISVYNRWGEKVFESDDPAFKWNGTFLNKKLDSGVYTYYMKAHLYNDEIIDQKGNVSLVK